MQTEKLSEWGLNPKQIALVLEENDREVGTVKKQLAGFDEMQRRLKQLEKTNEQSELLRQQVDQWRQKSQQVENEWKQKWQRRDFEEALGQALRQSGARSEKAVRALLDEEALRPGEEGALERIREAIDRLQVQHGYLFSAKKAPPQILRPGNRMEEDAGEDRIREIMGLPGLRRRKDDF
jgi:hypothetical protein